MARSVFNNINKIVTTKKITNALKLRIIRCYVYSTLLYGAETWTLNKQLEDRIETFEMWMYRRIGRISWKDRKTNEEVLNILGVKRELLKEIKFRQSRYFGHIKRHNTLLKTILEGKVEGKRARGRQRYKWEDNIKRYTEANLSKCTIWARDRASWRSITAKLHCGDGT